MPDAAALELQVAFFPELSYSINPGSSVIDVPVEKDLVFQLVPLPAPFYTGVLLLERLEDIGVFGHAVVIPQDKYKSGFRVSVDQVPDPFFCSVNRGTEPVVKRPVKVEDIAIENKHPALVGGSADFGHVFMYRRAVCKKVEIRYNCTFRL
jgi:hypothetical protein